MIELANLAGKPVVTATQMLESMIKAPRPTRAEASDVANAVLDGTDCVMLSGESAGGSYPLNAVGIMARTTTEAELTLNYKQIFENTKSNTVNLEPNESAAVDAVKASYDQNLSLIVVATEDGTMARLVMKYRP